MSDKGKIISQNYYEKESLLLKLYQEAFIRKEMNVNEAINALRMIGYSEIIAANKLKEWEEYNKNVIQETGKNKKQRQKIQASLEKYVLQTRLGKKYYIRFIFKRNELSKDDTFKKLVKLGFSEESTWNMVNEWETEK